MCPTPGFEASGGFSQDNLLETDYRNLFAANLRLDDVRCQTHMVPMNAPMTTSSRILSQ